MLLFDSPITAPVDTATAPTGVIGAQRDSSPTATSALPVVGAAAAGAAAGAAAANAADDGDSTPQGPLARANALAAERDWSHEETTYDDDPADEPQRKGRSPWTWPLIALILLLLFALVGFLLNSLGVFSPSNNPAATSSSSSPRTTSATPTRSTPPPTPTPTRDTPTPTPTPTQETVNVIPDAYLGKDYRQVQSELSALGLVVNGVQQESSENPGTVLDLNPTGPVPAGSTITVTYAIAPSPPPTTTAPTSEAPTTTAPSTAQSAPSPQLPLPACAAGEQPGTPPTCAP
jgi:serine/threonine-protein kinase